jgi:hypothetical protein
MNGEGLSAEERDLADLTGWFETYLTHDRFHNATDAELAELLMPTIRAIVARRESEAAEKALRDAAELVSDANAQGLGLGAAYRSILREADSVAEGREEW